MTEFEDSYKEFMNKIDLTSDAKGNFDKSTFFKEYESVFSENKVIANLLKNSFFTVSNFIINP